MTPVGPERDPGPVLPWVMDLAAAEWGWSPEYCLHQPIARTMALIEASQARRGIQPAKTALGLEDILRRHGIVLD